MRLFFAPEILGAEQCPKGLWVVGILELRGGKEKCQERKCGSENVVGKGWEGDGGGGAFSVLHLQGHASV